GHNKQLYVYSAWSMEIEASEFRNMVHQIIILEIRNDVPMQMPAIRINKRGEQRNQTCGKISKRSAGLAPGEPFTSCIYKEDSRPKDEPAMHVCPENSYHRQQI